MEAWSRIFLTVLKKDATRSISAFGTLKLTILLTVVEEDIMIRDLRRTEIRATELAISRTETHFCQTKSSSVTAATRDAFMVSTEEAASNPSILRNGMERPG